jgi:PAS domain S-box-containing protein
MVTKYKRILSYWQVILVFLAFFLVIGISYLFVSDIERKHLKQDAEKALDNASIKIETDLSELKTLMNVISETVRKMIMRGEDFEKVSWYLKNITEYMSDHKDALSQVTEIYGIFDTFDGKFYTNINWVRPEDYVHKERPWYKAAVEANGNVAITEPYMATVLDIAVITYSRRIMDDNGKPLGIICLDLKLDKIKEYATNVQLTENSYGILFNKQFDIVAHPSQSYLGKSMRQLNDGLSIESDLRQGINISERKIMDYRGNQSIAFTRQLENGWCQFILIPSKEYYNSLNDMAKFLSALGFAMAVALSIVLLRITAINNKLENRMHRIFDDAPFGNIIFDKNGKIIDCNMKVVKMFELSSKRECIDRFFELSPKYQPNGKLSREESAEVAANTLEKGSYRFEWMHQKLDGEPIPCEVVFVRTELGDEIVLMSYMRDLRESKRMIKEIKNRGLLLNTVNRAASILLHSYGENSFENSLLKSFELIGRCLDVDRVQIWRNEMVNGELYFVHSYEWLSEYGKKCVPVPIGTRFPYTMKPEWKELFLRKEYINSSLLDLPQSYQDFLNRYEIKSIVIIPLFANDDFWGFFSIDDCHIERTFSREEMEILTSAGSMISNAMIRNLQITKMREADEHMQIVFDNVPLGYLMVDKNYNVIECNQKAIKLFELSGRQECLDRFHELSPEYQPNGKSSRERIVALIDETFEKGSTRFEWMHRTLNDKPIPCEIILVRVKYKEDFTLIGYIRDLRGLKTMLDEIHKENEKSKSMAHWYNSILNAIPLPITVTDADAKWTFINTAVEEFLGITFKDAIGKSCSNWNAHICNTPDCGIECAKRGLKQTHYSDGDKSYQIDVATLKDLNDKTTGYIEVVQDITNLKFMAKKQAEVEAANHILENILNGIDAEIYVSVPHTGEILFINDYMKKKFNIEGDYAGKLCYKLFLDENQEKICDFCPCSQLDKDPHNTVVWELRLPTNHVSRNATRYIQWTDGRTVQIQYSVDITEIITAKEQAIQANKGKSSFLAKMSHEIRTPMNAILGITEIQLEDDSLSPTTLEALNKIYVSANLLLNIINDILDLSKAEVDKLELIPNKYDVASMIYDTVQLNVVQFSSKVVDFELDLDPNIPIELFGDELRIKQLLNNLLTNAFKYTDKGKVKLSIHSEWKNENPDVMLIFNISDTGQGMTEEQKNKIFDEYARFNLEVNRAIQGTGLGMSIVKHLIQMMNGEISVESKVGEGTVINVKIPQGFVNSNVLGEKLTKNMKNFNFIKDSQLRNTRIEREPMPYGNVLVVDDVESNLYVAKCLLQPYKLSIDTADDGMEAIEKIKSGKVYDVIFMDQMMPKMDGVEAVKIIRESGYSATVIALTANAIMGQAELLLKSGFDDFISKPIDIRQLNSVLNRFVRDKQSQEVIMEARRQHNISKISPRDIDFKASPDLLFAFARDAKKKLPIMDSISKNIDAATDEDLRLFTINVHAMKSALANIGEKELSATARKLEMAGKDGNKAVISADTGPFLNNLGEVIQKIEAEKNTSISEEEDTVYLKAQLLEFRFACVAYDKKRAKSILGELCSGQWSLKTKEFLDVLQELMLHSDFEKAQSNTTEFMELCK